MTEPTSQDRVDPGLAAGDFASWLTGMQAALRGEQESDVPCGTCTACCTSSQFVHIGPDEIDTLAHIPRALLFPAPRMAPGNVLLGYDERGHCPMLVDGACSIYEHRPRTCRTYDCRVFPAAGVVLDDDEKVGIAEQAARWKFDHPGPADEVRHAAVRAAAVHLRDRRSDADGRLIAAAATPLAVLAVRVHEAFIDEDESTGELMLVQPDPASVQAALTVAQRDAG